RRGRRRYSRPIHPSIPLAPPFLSSIGPFPFAAPVEIRVFYFRILAIPRDGISLPAFVSPQDRRQTLGRKEDKGAPARASAPHALAGRPASFVAAGRGARCRGGIPRCRRWGGVTPGRSLCRRPRRIPRRWWLSTRMRTTLPRNLRF
uniref:Uncharacterized protein n=1 Tax=Aegilops tauschii subsp. strangulata TaxID=200361 RepID=A0A453LT95_AEGTS